jgi:hypothetical protein
MAFTKVAAVQEIPPGRGKSRKREGGRKKARDRNPWLSSFLLLSSLFFLP